MYSYYIAWFSILILSVNNYAWTPLFLSAFICVIQLYFWCDLSHIRYWKKFLLSLTFLGYGIDCILTLTSFISFATNPLYPYFAPPWMLGLWLSFSVVCIGLVNLLKDLRSYLVVCSLFGFPVAYIGKVAFHVATFNFGAASCVIIGLIWMFLFPILCNKILFR